MRTSAWVRRWAMAWVGLILAGPGARAESVGRPLTVPPSDRAGFEWIAPVPAGVDFTNRLAPEAIVRNQNFMLGSGVALGDVDGDGRCDIYLAAIDGTNRLYLNRGDWRFEAADVRVSAALPGAHSTGAVLEDLDGDGDLDLVVTTMGGGPRFFLNDGHGRFSDATDASGLGAVTGSTTVAIGDVDGNGTLDLYVANYGAYPILRSGAGRAQVRQVNGRWVVEGPHAARLRVVNQQIEEVGEPGVLYLNDGHAHFKPVAWDTDAFVDEQGRPRSAPADFGLSAVLRDITGDGFPDLFTCNDFQTPDRMWINRGDGRFREMPRLAMRKFAFSSMGADFGDLDRDGNLDFFTVEMSPRRHERRQRSLTGLQFIPHLPGRFEYRPEVPRNTLYRGNGDGTWSELAEYAGLASTDWSWQPLFLDVDLDGFEDVLVASGVVHDVQDRDTLARIQSSGRSDSGTNVLLYPPLASPVSAFRNRGGFRFDDVHEAWGLTSTNLVQGAALADLDGDGDLDLVCNRLNDGPALYRNRSPGPRIAVRAHGVGGNLRGVHARIRITGGPVDQVQELVSGGRYLSGDDLVRTFATGTARSVGIEVTWRSGRVTRLTNALPNHLYVVEESDAVMPPPAGVPAKKPVFQDVTGALGHVHREELYDDFARQPLLHRQLSSMGPMVAWMDFVGDGRPFLVVGAARGGSPGVYRVRPEGGFQAVPIDWVAPDDLAGMASWVGADGRAVLLAAVSNYETPPASSSIVQLRLAQDGTRMEVQPWNEAASTPAALGPLASADFDGDGSLDLFVGSRVMPGRYPESGASRLFRGAAGGVAVAMSVPGLEKAGLVQGAVWSDLEADGFPELVLACEWSAPRIWRNHGGVLEPWDPVVRMAGEPARPLSSWTGWWTSVNAGDFDGDGRMDLVLGNWGLNTGYESSRLRPVRLYYGDLIGAGGVDLVEAYQPFDMPFEVPRRGRRPLTMAFPQLADRFPTHAAFAAASLPAVFEAIGVKASVVEAVELASVVLLNRGDALEAVRLPMEVQLSPVFGVSVADIDADGREDLLMGQNFFGMRMEWPRTDAGRGCVLRGDGRGGFAVLSARESGVLVHGEQRGAAVADMDGDGRVDWVDTQEGTSTRVFRNLTPSPGLRVRLKGSPGNPSGIGAVLRAMGPTGPGAAREIHGTSGQGSVDASVMVLGGDVRAVRVRWPGGRETDTPVQPGVRAVEVSAP